jgi:hypothetical protein
MIDTQCSTTTGSLLVSIYETQIELGGKLRPTSRSGVYKLVRNSELKLIKIGARSFITRASLTAYVDRLVEAAS